MTPKIPPGAYGPEHDGLLDPDRFTPAERASASPERLAEDHARRTSPSPVIRRFQRLTDAAFRRTGR